MPGLKKRRISARKGRGQNSGPILPGLDYQHRGGRRYDPTGQTNFTIMSDDTRSDQLPGYQGGRRRNQSKQSLPTPEQAQATWPNNTINALRQSEGVPINPQAGQIESIPDLTSQENSPLNYQPTKSQGSFRNKFNNTKGRLSSVAKKRIAAALVSLILGGGGLATMAAMSPVMQFLQIAGMMDDVADYVTDGFKTARLARNLSNILRYGVNSADDPFNRSRLGAVGNFVANRYQKRMKRKGIEFRTTLGNFRGISIDAKTYFDLPDDSPTLQGDGENMKKVLADSMGIDPNSDALQYNKDSKTFSIDESKLSKKQMKSMVKWANKRSGGRWRVSHALASRLLRIRVGVKGFHPFTDLRNKGINKLSDYLDRKEEELDGKDKDLRSQVEEDLKGDPSNLDENGNLPDGAVDDALDKIDSRTGKGLGKKAGKVLIKAGKGAIVSIPIVGLIVGIIDLWCSTQDAINGGGADHQARVVNPSENVAITVKAISSEIKNSNDPTTNDDDVSLDEIAMLSELYLFREVSVVEEDIDTNTGKATYTDTDEKEYSSWIEAVPVQAMLGQKYSVNKNGVPNGVPADLHYSKDTAGGIAGMNWLPDDIADLFVGFIDNPLAEGICWTWSKTGGAVMDWIASKTIVPAIEALSEKNELVNETLTTINYYTAIFMHGKKSVIEDAIPKYLITYAMYGARFTDNDMGMTNGALPMTDVRTAQIWNEQQEQLALEWQEKPLMERLFDKSDYRSAISQLAINAQWDMSDESIGTRLANVGKTIAATPKLMASAIQRISPASAATNRQPYNYGVSTWGFTEEEEDAMINSETYDIVNNTAYLQDKYFDNSEGRQYLEDSSDFNEKMKQCFGTIIHPDGTVTTENNQDGEIYNFYDDSQFDDCSDFAGTGSDGSDLTLRWRLYLMDYETIMSNAILDYGDGEDDEGEKAYSYIKQACDDMMVCESDASGSSSSSSDTGEQAQGAWGGYENGKIPLSAMVEISVPVTGGYGVGDEKYMHPDAAAAFEAMNAAYKKETGQDLSPSNAYRSLEGQKRACPANKNIGDRNCSTVAPLGYSNHGWGLAIDFNGTCGIHVGDCPADSYPVYDWLNKHAAEYGFARPQWARTGVGGAAESWHWEYVKPVK